MSGFEIDLDPHSGVPIYRQIISQILYAIARGDLKPGTQLPTVRRLAVDLSVNPNTVLKAYKELEIRGNLETHQGTGTFITDADVRVSEDEKRRLVTQLCRDVIARGGAYGVALEEIIEALNGFREER